MKKIIIILIILFFPIIINAENKEIEYVKEEECTKEIDKNDFKKNIIFTKENYNDTLLEKYPYLFVEEGKKEEKVDTNKLIYISFRNIKLKENGKNFIKIKTFKIYINGSETMFNTDGCENCANEGKWIREKKELYLYDNSEFGIVSYEEFKYNELKIEFITDTNEIVDSFEIVFSPIREFDAYKMQVNEYEKMNNLVMDKYYYFNNIKYVPVYNYYEKLYKCYEKEEEKKENEESSIFTPINSNKNNLISNSEKVKKVEEKTKPEKNQSNVKLLNNKENAKDKNINKNDKKDKITLVGSKDKKSILYNLSNNKFLLYYFISLVFLIALGIVFVINVKKCRAK